MDPNFNRRRLSTKNLFRMLSKSITSTLQGFIMSTPQKFMMSRWITTYVTNKAKLCTRSLKYFMKIKSLEFKTSSKSLATRTIPSGTLRQSMRNLLKKIKIALETFRRSEYSAKIVESILKLRKETRRIL